MNALLDSLKSKVGDNNQPHHNEVSLNNQVMGLMNEKIALTNQAERDRHTISELQSELSKYKELYEGLVPHIGLPSNNPKPKIGSDGIIILGDDHNFVTAQSLTITIEGASFELGDHISHRKLLPIFKLAQSRIPQTIIGRHKKSLMVVNNNDSINAITKVLCGFESIKGNHRDLVHPSIGKLRFSKELFTAIKDKNFPL
ncbi:hypothetical protein [Enterovibrio nigricans]|uniref:Uncharacterized protein n=1 Tax=Enterovibrio nigricans DSM 22720 TaxID=1121868 RepID=A0A1T4V5Y5_9GAMM|nr:hypothetical protein [Enterovibrio nigricans]PKF49392.1 hypothetical protein AT251_19175 [Enterovibrio nigricans]SKA60357.1 hypothetical protein SAMN02745132_03291 [Enterovibrio nigricans DSM 22720]